MELQHSILVRWYEKYPNLSAIINLSENLPLSFQEEVGEQLLFIAQQYQIFLNEGSSKPDRVDEKILESLSKSQQKNRWYDQIPSLHLAMNLLMFLPPEHLFSLDTRCVSLLEDICAFKVNMTQQSGIR